MKEEMVGMSKSISIITQLDVPHHFVVSTNTTTEHLDQLIRSEFMTIQLCKDTEFRLVDYRGHRVSLELLLLPPRSDTAEEFKYYISFDRTLPRYLPSDAHTILLRETSKNPALLFNPIMPGDEKVNPMCATMHVNLPMRIQMRRLPDLDHSFCLIEMRVDAKFGVSTPPHDSKNSWSCSSFRLKIRETSGRNPSLRPYSHNPTNDMAELSMMMAGEHTMFGEVMSRPMSLRDSGSRRNTFNCVYNPHAHRFVDEFAADQPLKEKTEAEKKEAAEKKEKPREPNEKEKEVTWRSGKQMTKRTEAGYIEWVVDVDGILKSTKESMLVMEKTFVQTFVLECDPRIKEPHKYEFDVIGEVAALFSGDIGSDEVFEVVQGQKIALNPGRKRISAVQHNKICVDAYPGAMAICCYKKGEEQSSFNSGLHNALHLEYSSPTGSDGQTPGPSFGPTNGLNPSLSSGPTAGPSSDPTAGPSSSSDANSGPTAGPNDSRMQDGHTPKAEEETIEKREEFESGDNLQGPEKEIAEESDHSDEMPEKETMTSSEMLQDVEKCKSPIVKLMQKLKGGGEGGPQKESPTKINKRKNKKKKGDSPKPQLEVAGSAMS